MEHEPDGPTAGGVRSRPHPIYFAGTAGWVAFAALATVLVVRHNDLPASTNWAVVGWGVLAAASGIIGPVLRWRATWVEVDATRVRYTTGILRPSTVELDARRARAMEVEQGMVGRWFGYGRLRLVDGPGTTHVLPALGHVEGLRAVVAQHNRRAQARRS
jgi:uncharacterized membrane protein YdbT with pleckstrin-like domain